jgi:hypothetical protein
MFEAVDSPVDNRRQKTFVDTFVDRENLRKAFSKVSTGFSPAESKSFVDCRHGQE